MSIIRRLKPYRRGLRIALHGAIVLFLTGLTQLGGIAWLIALGTKRKAIALVASYALLTLAAIWVAPLFGREALSCGANGSLQVKSWFYCAANRNYVTPETKQVLLDIAEEMDNQFPGTVTQVLDANFPFFNGFPLPPHLSHNDGMKADLAFYYRREGKYLPGATRSPIGYFAFDDGPSSCPSQWLSLRWDLRFLQPLMRDLELDLERTGMALKTAAEDARVEKIFIEPHLVQSLGLDEPNIRFQGCRAARHDDHFHVQLKSE